MLYIQKSWTDYLDFLNFLHLLSVCLQNSNTQIKVWGSIEVKVKFKVLNNEKERLSENYESFFFYCVGNFDWVNWVNWVKLNFSIWKCVAHPFWCSINQRKSKLKLNFKIICVKLNAKKWNSLCWNIL